MDARIILFGPFFDLISVQAGKARYRRIKVFERRSVFLRHRPIRQMWCAEVNQHGKGPRAVGFDKLNRVTDDQIRFRPFQLVGHPLNLERWIHRRSPASEEPEETIEALSRGMKLRLLSQVPLTNQRSHV